MDVYIRVVSHSLVLCYPNRSVLAHTYSKTTCNADAIMNPEKSLCFYGDVYYSYTMKQIDKGVSYAATDDSPN